MSQTYCKFLVLNNSQSFGKVSTQIPSRSMGNFCKYKQFFRTLCNSFIHTLYMKWLDRLLLLRSDQGHKKILGISYNILSINSWHYWMYPLKWQKLNLKSTNWWRLFLGESFWILMHFFQRVNITSNLNFNALFSDNSQTPAIFFGLQVNV